MRDYTNDALGAHKAMGGKIEITPKRKLETTDDWSIMYTPGVGAVARHIAEHPEAAREYTIQKNTIAVVSNGTAVLGLGNIGPAAALPVMEGKAAIFKDRAGVDAFPIVLDTTDPDEVVRAVELIAPGFGGINLEDIKAPECFEIERRLKASLTIPVMHDDQHGTAIVVLAGLVNAARVVEKNLHDMQVVIVGAGAAGRAIALLLVMAGVQDVTVLDSRGIIALGRDGVTGYKEELANITNPRKLSGDAFVALDGADAVIGVSGPESIRAEHIKVMAEKPIVFALANPTPEIFPDDVRAAGAAVVATGRSDFPNQINNSLVFPGIFRGALDAQVTDITDDMKLAAAHALAALVEDPTAEKIIPTNNDERVVDAVAGAVKNLGR